MRRFTPFYLGGVFLLMGCTNPVPAERADYVGEWRAPNMSVVIGRDGNIVYRRVEDGGTTTLNAPLREFDGDNFTVGYWPLLTTFEVSVPPREQGGAWTMIVDGVELRKE